MTKKNEIIEKLSDLEHQQWMHLTKYISSKENISKERLNKWKKLYIPYSELSEEDKEQDRIWARKVYDVLMELNKKK